MPNNINSFAEFIARHADALETHLELDGIANATPESFIADLEGVGAVFEDALFEQMREGGEELNAAAGYLREALPLTDGDPRKTALFRRADRRLINIDAYV